MNIHSRCSRVVFLLALSLGVVPRLPAQGFTVPFLADSAALAREMPVLAVAAMARLGEGDRMRALDDLFRLEIVAGRYDDAVRSLTELRAMRARAPHTSLQLRSADIEYEIWARAMSAAQQAGGFDDAYAAAFRGTFRGLDDRTSALVIRTLTWSPVTLQGAVRSLADRLSGKHDVPLRDVVALVRAYQRLETHRAFAPLVAPLIAADDARRYVTERDVQVRVPDGATICAWIMRPRGAEKRPALLQFTIYVDSTSAMSDIRRAASNGYAGVTAYTRGKACGSDVPIEPYRHDGADAAAVIDWIATRPWSDGQVGMYGGSYSGFTAWAATKYMPRALKAIMVGAPAYPGIDAPMEGNVFWNFQYPWPFYTMDNKSLDTATYFDAPRWARLDRAWYTSGRAYRDLDRIDGTPNPGWDAWLAHPSWDDYWRSTGPHGPELARVTIPILQTAGYFFGGPGGAVPYLTEHVGQNPTARHFLLIGPYDHFQGQRGVVNALGDTVTSIAGYETDPIARIDITADLRYQWFDWIMRGGSRPALLRDRINYEVLGANRWRHAPSLDAMSNGTLRFHLVPKRLVADAPATDVSTTLAVDLAYRGDADTIIAGGGIRDSAVNSYGSLELVSDPIVAPTEIAGLYSGHLELVTNKRDFDLSVNLFELTPKGDYIQLPPVQLRASYARDLSTRRLLTPGAPETIDFKAVRLISRQMERGSRIVAVIGVLKSPQQQINYGSGKPVNDETIADAGAPLEIRLSSRSYLDIPVRR
jgi:putative CocE/NonD family hydrolase